MDDTKTTISRAYKSAARWQIITTLFLSLATWVLVSMHAALSVFMGGASVLLGGYISVSTIWRRTSSAPGSILIALLKAELIRIMMIALLLLAAFRFYEELVPIALIGGLAAAALISGAGLRTLGNTN